MEVLKERTDQELTEAIIGAAIEVHRALGPGLLESCYEACVVHELLLRGIAFRQQKEVPVHYKDQLIDCAFRYDLLVEDRVVVEIKAVESLTGVHEAQLLTYLKLTRKRIGS